MKTEKEGVYRMQLYSGSLVIFIGVFYIMAIIIPLFQDQTAVSVSSFSLRDLKMLFYAVFYTIGGILLLMSRRTGWVICTASLLNIVLITAFVVIDSLRGGWSQYQILPFFFLVLAVAGLLFMFSRLLRTRFGVNNKSYLLVILLYLILLFLTYRL